MRRALQRYIEDPLSDALIQGQLPRPAYLEIFLAEDGIYYRPIEETEDDVGDTREGDGGVTVAQASPLYMFS